MMNQNSTKLYIRNHVSKLYISESIISVFNKQKKCRKKNNKEQKKLKQNNN